MAARNVKPDDALVLDLAKVVDKYRAKNPEGHTSVVLASIGALFQVVWKLLPRASRNAAKSETGYNICASLPSVKLEKIAA
jgi:hypothetical protein